MNVSPSGKIRSLPLLRVDKAGDRKGMIGETLNFTINVTNLATKFTWLITLVSITVITFKKQKIKRY